MFPYPTVDAKRPAKVRLGSTKSVYRKPPAYRGFPETAQAVHVLIGITPWMPEALHRRYV